MSELESRLAALSPEKRRLLERRLAREAARPAKPAAPASEAATADYGPPRKPLDFSLFFFSADGSTDDPDKYRTVFECARFGDREGFTAVWVPERHFQDFGGLYPNPSVLAAALAVATERVQIRAGSVVIPLHHPVRVAEEWAMVDNLSHGRAAIACASGWHPADFVFRPGAFEERKEVMYRDLETLRRLWAGQTVRLPGGGGEEFEVRILPRPIQEELPVWITSAGSARTWERAGEVGAHLLASLAAQPLEDLRRKIALYREARKRAGHDPETGVVSLMLHTFLGDDFEEVKAEAREPLSDYLRTYMKQREGLVDLPGITERDKEALIPLAYEHYLRSASLVGTVESCAPLLDRLAAVGVDEIACLTDFGMPLADVAPSLERLSELWRRHRSTAVAPATRCPDES